MKALKPIFSRHPVIDKMSFVNWRTDSDSIIGNTRVLADGYFRAGITLTKICIRNNRDKKADVFIFPILNNLNHGIELYLKAILWNVNESMGMGRKMEGKHNIRQIYQTLKSRIGQAPCNISSKQFGERTAELRAYLDELYTRIKANDKNDKMDFSRYPFGHQFENHFYVDQMGTIEIDLVNLRKRFETIQLQLETLSDYLYYDEEL